MKRENNYAPLRVLVLFVILFVVGTIPDDENNAFAQASAAIKKPAKTATAKRAAKTTKDIANLDEALKTGLPVILKLGSDKCRPCIAMNPIIKELAEEQEGKAVFLSLDVYQNRELARQAGVRVIPTILFYDKHGKPKAKNDGGMSKEDLLKAIKELELDK